MKKPGSIELRINGNVVLCEYAEDDYYGGDMPLSTNVVGSVGDTRMHVEVLPVVVKPRRTGECRCPIAKNTQYQSRIDDWMTRNEECQPRLITIPGLGKCFVHVEVFAQ